MALWEALNLLTWLVMTSPSWPSRRVQRRTLILLSALAAGAACWAAGFVVGCGADAAGLVAFGWAAGAAVCCGPHAAASAPAIGPIARIEIRSRRDMRMGTSEWRVARDEGRGTRAA